MTRSSHGRWCSRAARTTSFQNLQYLPGAGGHAVEVDGIFGLEPDAAVRAFQPGRHLAVDGVVGPKTWRALVVEVSQGSTGDGCAGSRRSSSSITCPVIRVRACIWTWPSGPKTSVAVRDLQQAPGIVVDGVAGPLTWRASSAACCLLTCSLLQPAGLQRGPLGSPVRTGSTATWIPGHIVLTSGRLIVVCVRVLVVDDEVRTAALLRRGLAEEGYAVDVAEDAAEAMWRATEFRYDAVVLDVLLPEMDGFEVCRALRASGCWAPVLMLTARRAVQDRVRGLDAGADDYLTKPFSFSELTARLRALMRRGPAERPAVLQVGDLRLDPARRQVWLGQAEVALSAKEFALLELFLRHPGQVLSRARILEHVWDYAYDGVSNVVDQYVGYLRRKIDRPSGVQYLETVRGAGYRLRAHRPAGPG